MAQHRNTSARTRSRIGTPVLAAGIGIAVLVAGLIPVLSAGAQPDLSAGVPAAVSAADDQLAAPLAVQATPDRQSAASRSDAKRSLVAGSAKDTAKILNLGAVPAVDESTASDEPAADEPTASDEPADSAKTPAAAATKNAQPKTEAEAKQAWLEAAHQAEVVNQQVLAAEGKVKSSKASAKKAELALAATAEAVRAAGVQVRQAQSSVDAYQAKLNEFAGASFRGARLSQFSSLLTAQSAEDFLDQASSMDQLAVDAQQTTVNFQAAKAAALAAQSSAEAARAQATQVSADAAAAVLQAKQDVKDLEQRRVELKGQVASYRELTASLTISEQAAAIAAFEDANITDADRARYNAQAAVRAEAGISENDQNLSKTLDLEHTAPDAAAATAVAAALSAEGLPYVWGAVGPDTFDCSGLMMWAWAKAGISIPRTSAEQFGLPEVAMDQLQPGDLVTYYSPVTHVGMYIGRGLVIHASTEGVPIKIADVYKAGPNPTGHRVPR